MIGVGRIPCGLLQRSTRDSRHSLSLMGRIVVVGKVPRRHACVLPWYGRMSCIVIADGRCC